MWNKENCCIFIISYQRANNVTTYNVLKNRNYTGKIYLVVSDDDEQLNLYKQNFPNQVVVFNKKEVAQEIDACDNFDGYVSDIYSRNIINKIAKELGIDYYLVLDDDYNNFSYRRIFGNTLKGVNTYRLDEIFDACFEYLIKTPSIDCFTLCQNGDLIGGANSLSSIGGKRKIMNSFFISANNPIKFLGRMNGDVNTYLYYGSRGKLFFTINDIALNQLSTQTVKGGMSGAYNNSGTYMKSFYSVIVAPSAVKIHTISHIDTRIHHKINWEHAVPKLIREEYKK